MGQIKNIKLHIVTDIKFTALSFGKTWLTKKEQRKLPSQKRRTKLSATLISQTSQTKSDEQSSTKNRKPLKRKKNAQNGKTTRGRTKMGHRRKYRRRLTICELQTRRWLHLTMRK